EGFGPSVEARAERLSRILDGHGSIEVQDEEFSRNFWRDIGAFTPLATAPGTLWRVSGPPAQWVETVLAVDAGAFWLVDWAGGLVWVLAPPDLDLDARRGAMSFGGRASLVRGGEPSGALAPEPSA